MKVSVLGSGPVGEALANGFLQLKYDVLRAGRYLEKLEPWLAEASGSAFIGSIDEAVVFADLIVLAVAGVGAEDTILLCGSQSLAGKIVIDVTNPIDSRSPTEGVVRLFSDHNYSLMERLQSMAPEAHFVKAFSCVGKELMICPDFGGQIPTMFICGNNVEAKVQVAAILKEFGWDALDMGLVESARAIEPLCMLWCLPGLREQKWGHALKLLRKW